MPAASAPACCRWAPARRPRAAVPRRHAGLSGGPVRGHPRRPRAGADQHADALRPAAILSRGLRRLRSPSAMPPSPTGSMPTACQGTRLDTLDRRQRRAGVGRPRCKTRSPPPHWLSGPPAAPGGRRHAPRRHGVLDVLVGLHRPAEGHRASAARHGLHAPLLRPPSARADARRHLLLGAQDLLRLRPRQLHHLPVRGGRVERAAAGPAQARRHLRLHRPLPAHRVLRPADALHRAHQGAGGQGRRT